jgi:hypothetical protein
MQLRGHSQMAEQMWLPDLGLLVPKNYELNKPNFFISSGSFFRATENGLIQSAYVE